MAEILPFAKGRAERKRDAGKAAGEIVIFPGVRVEYHDPSHEPPGKPRSRRPRRNSAGDVLSA
jgi:hypothetical protein